MSPQTDTHGWSTKVTLKCVNASLLRRQEVITMKTSKRYYSASLGARKKIGSILTFKFQCSCYKIEGAEQMCMNHRGLTERPCGVISETFVITINSRKQKRRKQKGRLKTVFRVFFISKRCCLSFKHRYGGRSVCVDLSGTFETAWMQCWAGSRGVREYRAKKNINNIGDEGSVGLKRCGD